MDHSDVQLLWAHVFNPWSRWSLLSNHENPPSQARRRPQTLTQRSANRFGLRPILHQQVCNRVKAELCGCHASSENPIEIPPNLAKGLCAMTVFAIYGSGGMASKGLH
eukprot:6008559-Amphidinium_carterae.1